MCLHSPIKSPKSSKANSSAGLGYLTVSPQEKLCPALPTCNGTAFEDTRASSLSDRWGVFGAEVREVRKKLPNLKEYVKSMQIYLAMAYS